MSEQHELHGAIIGLGVWAALWRTGVDYSALIGGVTGAVAAALMRKYGHPDFFGGG